MGLRRDFLIGLAVVGVIALIFGVIAGILFFITKAFGILLALGGIFMMLFFPDVAEAQAHAMSKTGIILGIIMLVAGVWFLLFA